MLKRLTLGAPIIGDSANDLWFLQPVTEAGRAGTPLAPAMVEAVRRLGFESFMYALATEPRSDRTTTAHVWTTLPDAWVDEYDCNGYIDDDPRLTLARGRASPLIWDAATIPARGRGRHFLERAARYGIRSGVMVMFNDATGARIVAGFHSPISPVNATRQAAIRNNLGNLMMASAEFHDHIVVPAFAGQLYPVWRGPPLTRRELECLELAARGMTSSDIGLKLGIAERTVNFHCSNLLLKLGVLNRHEAIALAVNRGLIQIGSCTDAPGGMPPLSFLFQTDAARAAGTPPAGTPWGDGSPALVQTRARNQSRSAAIVGTTAAGFNSARPSGGCAPYATATAATPALCASWISCVVSPIITVSSGVTPMRSIR